MMTLKAIHPLSLTLAICLLTYSALLAQIPQEGLIGYYMLDGNADDSSSFGHDGEFVNQVLPTTNRFGDQGKACRLVGGYIDAGNPTAYQITGALSISAWIKPLPNSSWSGIVSKWAGFGEGAYYLGINPDTKSVRWNLDMPIPLEGDEVIYNEWLHVVSTYDGDTVRIFENGVLVNKASYNVAISNVSANLLIGNQYDIPDIGPFLGAIDDVLIYDRALTPEEVEQIFNDVVTSTDTPSLTGQIKVFPNPTNGIINISNDYFGAIHFSVFDANGNRLISQKSGRQIDLSHLTSGTYYLQLNYGNNIEMKKIILL